MLDIRIVLGVVTVLFLGLAIFSPGDHSINLFDKINWTSDSETDA